MELSVRPWFTTGIALVGAGAIAVAPVAPPTPDVQLRAAVTPVSAEVALVDSQIPYILSLPVLRARIGNWVEQWEVFLQGLALSGAGVVETVAGLPDVTVTIIQQLADLDFQGALNTFVTAVSDAVVDIGEPLLTSWIWRQQNALEVDVALVEAWPQAFIDVATASVNAAGEVVNASLQGASEVAQAILTLNLENIVNAAIEATQGVVASFGTGAGLIVAGIESAQMALAEAWMAGPPPPFGAQVPEEATVADVPDPAASFVTVDAAGQADVEETAPVEDDVPEEALEDGAGEPEDGALDTAELEDIETEET
ncbi:MAG: hypothetical protein SW019_26270, partial [Actinomycetota bacterium]|nr:hypothetical protein [Actinomycetota bacterium]